MKMSKVLHQKTRHTGLATYAVLSLSCGHVQEFLTYSPRSMRRSRKVPKHVKCSTCEQLPEADRPKHITELPKVIYKVKLQKCVKVHMETTVEVEATNEDDARDLAHEIDVPDSKWTTESSSTEDYSTGDVVKKT